ncbi:hypothetical protein EON65_48865 [archaeon]|nr:MAG: hypothetical protein EON65_48865 [archaeon]
MTTTFLLLLRALAQGAMDAVLKFFNSKDSLPMHSGNRRNNGVKGIPVVDKGVRHSRHHSLIVFH